MIPPTSIDGTDITGATIDGTDVQEITVDGDVVFTAGPSFTLPVAYSNLVGWYPFDAATYGGSNADDVTAIIGGSGDDTAYNGSVSGATYQSSGGVTDINAGANSGAFDFDGLNDEFEVNNFDNSVWSSGFSFMGWFNLDTVSRYPLTMVDSGGDFSLILGFPSSGEYQIFFSRSDNSNIFMTLSNTQNTGIYIHMAATWDSATSSLKTYENGNLRSTNTTAGSWQGTNQNQNMVLGHDQDENRFADVTIDDVRSYNTALSASQISQIYNNTKP